MNPLALASAPFGHQPSVARLLPSGHSIAQSTQPRSPSRAFPSMAKLHLDTLLVFLNIETGGTDLPTFFTDEFATFLQRGSLAHSFLRLS